MSEVNFYQVVQEKYNIVDVARNMLGLELKQVGAHFRARSQAQSSSDNLALELIPETNSFRDFALNITGDVTELVARFMFNGDKAQALRHLVPELYSQDRGKAEKALKAKKDFEDNIEFWSKQINRQESRIALHARQYLLSRGFTMQTVNELKIGLMEDCALNEMRIVFPYWDEQAKNVVYFTTRKFPYFEKYENGKPVGEPYEHENSPKYKKASTERFPFLHNAPMGLNTLKRKGLNGNRILVITEGVCDWLAFYQEGYSVVAPNGCGDKNFWDVILKKIGEFKKVLLAFDNDEAGKEFTYKAAKVLMEHDVPFDCAGSMSGIKDVAEYYQVAGNLNAIVNSAVNGFTWIIDSLVRPEPFEDLPINTQRELMRQATDVLNRMAVDMGKAKMHEALLSLKKYFPKDWVTAFMYEIKDEAKKGQRERKKEEQMRVVDQIVATHNLMYDPRVGFYEYSAAASRWEHKHDENIGGYIIKALGQEATGTMLTQILKLLKSDDRIVNDALIRKFNTLPLMTFKNGTLHINLETGKAEIAESVAEDYNTVTLPYFYRTGEKCENWLKFIEEITGGDQVAMRILQEFPAYALMPNCKHQKALLLKGGGANGKSVYTDIISALFGGIGDDGRGYVSGVEPSKFKENFRLMPFRHSFLNISSDTETDLKGGEGVFKKIVAGEVLEDSYKHKDNIPFITRTKLIMCCNNFPSTKDTTVGFMRRFLVVEFPMHYVPNPRPNTNERLLDPNLKETLLKELPGIFNWVLEGLKRLIAQNGFTTSSEQFTKEFRSVNDPLYSFAEENAERFFDSEGKGKCTNRKNVFRCYVKWAETEYVPIMPANRFYSNIKSVLNTMGITFTEQGIMWQFDDNPDMRGSCKMLEENA